MGNCVPSIDSDDIEELKDIKTHFAQQFLGTESRVDRENACKTIDKEYRNYVANIYPESCGYLRNKASETQKATEPTTESSRTNRTRIIKNDKCSITIK